MSDRRVNVLVTESLQHASLVREFLEASGIDSRLLTKRAVQVPESELPRVAALNAEYPAWVERKNTEAKERGAHG